nr:hypothetical protein Iba_chr13bCG9210 [Ipomoea batatas]
MEAAVTTADWLRKSSAVPTANVACGCGAYCSTANILLWKEWRMLSGTCKWETKEIGNWSSGVVESVNLIGIRKRTPSAIDWKLQVSSLTLPGLDLAGGPQSLSTRPSPNRKKRLGVDLKENGAGAMQMGEEKSIGSHIGGR